MGSTETGKSELALAIEQRKRKLYEFEVQGFFGIGDKEIPKLAIRAPVKLEENESIAAAHARAKSMTAGDDRARSDDELLDDLKLKEILQRTCFVAGRTTKAGDPIQAFPGGMWMEKYLSTEQLAVLYNLLQEVKKTESPMLWDISMDDVRGLAMACYVGRNSDIPERALSRCSDTYLTTAFVLLSCEWAELKAKQEMVDHVLGNADDGHPGGGSDQGELEASPSQDPSGA